MLKKIAQITNLVLWVLLFFVFVFNDYFGISVYCDDGKSFGIYHILAILFGLVGVVVAIVAIL